MSDYQDVFRRKEIKYVLTTEQYAALRPALTIYMQPDKFFSATISNVYYDTEDFELIRMSLDKPMYKEKLRIRGYGSACDSSNVFVEIKKKFKGIVYKRRVKMPLASAEIFLSSGLIREPVTQIHREIDYFRKFHAVVPKLFLAYDREAIIGKEDSNLRITFDRNIRFRTDNLSIAGGSQGALALPANNVLMELKVPDAIPIWLSRLLSRNEAFPTSFSKYGKCYEILLSESCMNTEVKRDAV